MNRDMKSLTTRGYGVPFSHLSQEELCDIKKELTVEPFVNKAVNTKPQDNKSFSLYRESKVKLYMPKNYGFARFGVPEKDSIPEGDAIDVEFVHALRPEQDIQVNAFLRACQDPAKRGGIINVGCGGGKCLGRDTWVVMFDHTLRKVQDVVVGECLMGDDGKSRTVTSVCRGTDKLYQIRPLTPFATPYVVNRAHILTLKDKRTGEKQDVPLTTYLYMNTDERAHYQGITHFYNYSPKTRYDEPKLNLPQLIPFATVHALRASGFLVDYNTHTSIVRHVHFHDESEFVYDINVHEMGPGEYYGFTLERGSNRRFLLSDCTVTHNTVMGLNAISRLKKKTLIVVHKEFLIQQWKERIQTFLPRARVGLFKAKTIDVNGKDIVIGSLQSLSMKSYDSDLFASFGFIVVDEVHRTGTEVFSHALHHVFKYSLGLTATLQRKDGMTKVFKWFLGDPVTDAVKSTQAQTAKVLLVDIEDEDPRYCQEVVLFNGNVNYSRMINNVAGYEPRTLKIIDVLERVFMESNKTRKFLVLSDRKTHLKDMARFLNGRGISHGFYIGGMKDEDLKKSEGMSVILATFSFASEGFDVADLDTVILATPKSDIEQSVGRIFRKRPEDRQNIPVIIDIQDDFSLFAKQNKKRYQYYKKRKFSLEKVKAE